MLTPKPSLTAISRRLQLPGVEHATLAADSPDWRRSHDQITDAAS